MVMAFMVLVIPRTLPVLMMLMLSTPPILRIVLQIYKMPIGRVTTIVPIIHIVPLVVT